MIKGSIGFVGGLVRTLDPTLGLCEAVLVENGEIVVVGSTVEVARAAAERRIPTVDLGGKIVLPGPIDTHFHLVHTGLDLSAIDLGECTSVDEVLQLVEGRVRAASPQQWILGRGLDEFKIREGRPPTARSWTSFRRRSRMPGDAFTARLNSWPATDRIPSASGVGRSPGDRDGGQIAEKLGEAWKRFLADMDEETKRRAILDGLHYAAACGLTAVHAMDGGDFSGDGEIRLLLAMQADVPVRVLVHWNTWDIEAVATSGLRVLGGDLWLDGSLGSRTAALLEPYADVPTHAGLLYHPAAKVEGFIRDCLAADLQVGFHAIGDRAIEQALDCFEAACKGGGIPDRRFRLDHFGLPTIDQVRRAADLGVLVSTQPTFPYLRGGPGSVYETRIGKERVARAYPLRELLDAGLLVAGGSDSNVLPADVMLGIHAAANHPNESQRISAEEALRLYTENAARSEFEEGERGTLAPGKSGDMIIVGEDPCTVPPGRIKDIKIITTVVEGRVAYQKSS
jgi:predicted amidohydrolase YtcJ